MSLRSVAIRARPSSSTPRSETRVAPVAVPGSFRRRGPWSGRASRMIDPAQARVGSRGVSTMSPDHEAKPILGPADGRQARGSVSADQLVVELLHDRVQAGPAWSRSSCRPCPRRRPHAPRSRPRRPLRSRTPRRPRAPQVRISRGFVRLAAAGCVACGGLSRSWSRQPRSSCPGIRGARFSRKARKPSFASSVRAMFGSASWAYSKAWARVMSSMAHGSPILPRRIAVGRPLGRSTSRAGRRSLCRAGRRGRPGIQEAGLHAPRLCRPSGPP